MVIQTDDGWWLGKGMSEHGSAEEAHRSYTKDYSWPRKRGTPETVSPGPLRTSAVVRRLKVFISYASEDRPMALDMWSWLDKSGADPWFDKKKLLPGQKWRREISRALKETDVVVACLSQASTRKKGYVHKELREALEEASLLPDGSIFLIPLRLDQCEIPDVLSDLHVTDYFQAGAKAHIAAALKARASEVHARIPQFELVDT